MKTVKEVLDFSNDFVFYDIYNIERVIKINHVRDWLISELSKYDHFDENLHLRVSGVIDDISQGHKWQGWKFCSCFN